MYESPYIAPALDQSVSLRRHVTFQTMRVFSGWGYREVQVPLIDYFDAYRRTLDEDAIAETLRFVNRDGNVMMLRADVTPAVAKVISYQLDKQPVPIRASYANKVVRTSRSAPENIERYHLGVELVGVRGLVGDLEIFLVALEVMERLGIQNFQFNVCDNGVANHLLNATGAPRRIRDDVWEAIIARDASEVVRILSRLGIRQHYIDAISAMASLEGGLHQLEQIQQAMPNDRALVNRLEDMRTVFSILKELGFKRHIRLDMAELGGADYYTGISFNIVSEKVGRSIGRGGRYDSLFAEFGSPSPAVGFSVIADVMAELITPSTTPVRPGPGDEVVQVESEMIPGLEAALERRRFNKPVSIEGPQ